GHEPRPSGAARRELPVTEPAPLPATHDIPRGTSVGKYEVLRKIATGGMAEIYLARSRGTAGFEKLVVLKRILPHVAEDPMFVSMFLDEARLAASLSHPNIADVYDVGEADGSYFFTMEYVHGEDARTIRMAMRKRGERLPLNVALAIVHGIASALDYTHEKTGPDGPLGLVHRDVSSSNIIVSYDGAVKLVDFGIARATARVTKTLTGALKGKIPYMSPEQCRGQALDHRSDLFSLGVVMFELTLGRRPFRGDSDFAIMEQIVHGEPQRPRELDPDYPLELELVVMRLLDRDPAARYQSAEALREDLEAFITERGLFLSTKPLGKYMRALFEDKISAWERAEQEGVSFAQHVATTVTADSRSSAELVTPPSAMPALPRRSAEQPVAHAASVPARSRRGIVIGGACLTTLAVAGIVFALIERSDAPPPTAAVPTPAPVVESVPPPAPPVVEATPVQEPTITTKSAPVQEPTITKPAPVHEPTITKPAKPVAKLATKPGEKTIAKPSTKPKKPVVKKPPTKPGKEESWDPDSPFLPPN
ncbi:MAG TPA: serine/threonine-protein kinase, partial [Kofleriaceae bacterium]